MENEDYESGDKMQQSCIHRRDDPDVWVQFAIASDWINAYADLLAERSAGIGDGACSFCGTSSPTTAARLR